MFGSRAKGTNSDQSDIDLVIKNSLIDRKKLGKIKMEIEESNIPYLVDLQVFENIKSKDLVNHIERGGKTIYKSELQ